MVVLPDSTSKMARLLNGLAGDQARSQTVEICIIKPTNQQPLSNPLATWE